MQWSWVLLPLLCATVHRAAADGCLAREHLKVNVGPFTEDYNFQTAPTGYCGDIFSGGDYSYSYSNNDGSDWKCNEGWVWSDPGSSSNGFCYKKGDVNNKCQCAANDCYGDSRTIYCFCHMDGSDKTNYCFRSVYQCQGCNEGEYRHGCGCTNELNPSCSAGSCERCPAGFQCPHQAGVPAHPLPCPPRTYQNEIGKTWCKPCTCPDRHYIPMANHSAFDRCGFDRDVTPLCKPCSECTPDSDRIQPHSDTVSHKSYSDTLFYQWGCPDYNRNYHMDRDAVCRPCLQCADTKQYVVVPRTLQYSYMQTVNASNGTTKNKTITETLVLDYCRTVTTFDASGQLYACEEQYDDTVQSDQIVEKFENQIIYKGLIFKSSGSSVSGTANYNQNIVKGVMPWRAGRQRIEGLRARPQEHEEIVPYYVTCAAADDAYSARQGYALTTDSNRTAQQTVIDWSLDCLHWFAYDCLVNYYATVFTHASYKLSILDRCTACPPHSTSAGGMVTGCLCEDGYAQKADLVNPLSRLFENNDFFARLTGTCLDCISDIVVRKGNAWHQMALACARDKGILVVKVCDATSISNGTHCIPCASPMQEGITVTTFADPERKRCMHCPVGHQTQAPSEEEGDYVCVPCDPLQHEYQNEAGQTHCKRKRLNCSRGSYVELNYDTTRDNNCTLCTPSCPAGSIRIMSSNRTQQQQDTCDGDGHYYFGCYQNLWGAHALSAVGVRVAYTYQAEHAEYGPPTAHVEWCDNALLPPNAEWVSYAQAERLECYFACKYALGANASRLRDHIGHWVHTRRADLIDLLPRSPETPSNVQDGTVSEWVMFSGGTSFVSNTWRMHKIYNIHAKNEQSMYLNTFLLVDELMRTLDYKKDVCQSPSEAYHMPCQPGFRQQTQLDRIHCALDARQQGLLRAKNTAESQSYFFVKKEENTAVCRADGADLKSFVAGCTVDCMAERLQSASNAQQRAEQEYYEGLTSSPLWLTRLSWIHTYLQRLDNRAIMPYELGASVNTTTTSQECDIRCKNSNDFFMYALSAHSENKPSYINSSDNIKACIPISMAAKVCQSVYDPPRFNQTPSQTQITIDDVCIPCAPLVYYYNGNENINVGTLISANDKDNYEQWWSVHNQPTLYGSLFNDDQWPKMQCRYTCHLGYSSNNEGPASYKENPCVPCGDARQHQNDKTGCGNGSEAVFFKDSKWAQSTTCPPGYEPYVTMCQRCYKNVNDKEKYQFYPSSSLPFSEQSACLALCKADKYHTLGKEAEGSYVTAPASISRITCQPCNDNPNVACGNSCSDGYYKPQANTTDCFPCSTEACPAADQYRPLCTHTPAQNAQCTPCGDEYLFNRGNASVTSDKELQDAITSHAWKPTRVYVPLLGAHGFVVSMQKNATRQCLLACINNHAWIDARTGLSPFAAATTTILDGDANLHCLPCNSQFMLRGLRSTAQVSRQLYAVWNSTNTTSDTVPLSEPGSALASMARVRGGCFLCPWNRDTLDTWGAPMCELQAGFSSDDQGSHTTVTIDVGGGLIVQNNNASGQPQRPTTITQETPSRRLLLVASEEWLVDHVVTMQTRAVALRIKRPPVLTSPTSYSYSCCNQWSTQTEACKRLQIKQLEYKTNKIGNDFNSYCHNDTSSSSLSLLSQQQQRRLLQGQQQQAAEQACLVGTYKNARGKGPCFMCTSGASGLPQEGSTTPDNCLCLPGYFATRTASGTLLSCTPCGHGFSRAPTDAENRCLPCPRNTQTPTATSAFCYCIEGAYITRNGECTLCEPNFYCVNNTRFECPQHSHSPPGARARGECKCDAPLYFGDLAVSDDAACVMATPGMDCAENNNNNNNNNNVMMVGSACPCATGWRKVEASSGHRAKCLSDCKLGEYALLGAQQALLRCEPCPLDTYADNTESVGACTPCPPGLRTPRAGAVSRSSCQCIGTLLNETTCRACADNEYFESGRCQACPAGTTAPPGSTMGLASCLCPVGQRALYASAAGLLRCEPCPLGYFSRVAGSTCTPCPTGFTTAKTGCRTPLDCRVPSA